MIGLRLRYRSADATLAQHPTWQLQTRREIYSASAAPVSVLSPSFIFLSHQCSQQCKGSSLPLRLELISLVQTMV